MYYLGIDPGQSGGIAILSDRRQEFALLKKLDDTETGTFNFLEEFCDMNEQGLISGRKAWIENVHAMPKQGVASSFKFGRNYGFLRGLLIALRIPFDTVSPSKWQRTLGCLSKGDKNVTKAAAERLFPWVRVAHWNADALLIAEYGRRSKT